MLPMSYAAVSQYDSGVPVQPLLQPLLLQEMRLRTHLVVVAPFVGQVWSLNAIKRNQRTISSLKISVVPQVETKLKSTPALKLFFFFFFFFLFINRGQFSSRFPRGQGADEILITAA
jgi:hypothetical protein